MLKKLIILSTAAAMAGCAYHSVAARKTALLREGSSLLQHGELEQAEVKFEDVLKDDAGDPYALNYLGNVYERQERYQEALAMYQKAASRPLTLVEELDAPSFNGMSITQLAEKNVERVRSIMLGKVMTEVEATRKELTEYRASAGEGNEPKYEEGAAEADDRKYEEMAAPVQEEPANEGNLENILALYKAAYTDFLNQEYDKSLKKFTRVLELSRDHQLSDNAQYWIGEIYYSTKDFNTALKAFRKVVNDFPKGNKVPDATLKIGYTYLELKDKKSAERVLRDVIKSFPNTYVASLARKKLSRL